MSDTAPGLYSGDLYCEYYIADAAPRRGRLREWWPGLVLCAVAALAAGFLSLNYAMPVMLLGLLIGLALSFAGQEAMLAPGLDLASRRMAQGGIALLGLQIAVADVLALGWGALAGLLLVMSGAMATAMLVARSVGESREFGILAGGATAICGASAAVALYGALGPQRIDKTRFAMTLVGVAIASAIAMAAYPGIARALGFSDVQAGFLIGASVHDAAQAIAGGFAFSDAAGSSATVTKLARVSLLGPVVAIVGVMAARGRADPLRRGRRFPMPWFVAVFVLLAAANSVLALPPEWAERALEVSKALLLLAVIAIAIRSQPHLLLRAGWRTLAPVVAASLAAFLIATLIAATVIA